MRMPAARMLDQTTHGGVVMKGELTVLIGGQPAARLSDVHVCPMVNGPAPHVGNPVQMGSPTVQIGGQWAARQTDVAPCSGPPDTIMLGCQTVQIGTGIGVAPPGAGTPAGAAAQFSVQMALTNNTEATSLEQGHWVVFDVVDSAGLPIPGIPYAFTDSDDASSEGVLGPRATIRRNALSQGQCQVQLFSVHNARWSTDAANVGEEVTLTAEVEGFEPGTPARFQIYRRDFNIPDDLVGTIEVETQGDAVEATWAYIAPEEPEGFAPESGPVPYAAPQYYFEVFVGRCRARSGLLNYQDWLEIRLMDENGEGVADAEYIVYLSNGEVRRGTLDGDGYRREERVPPCAWDIAFPNTPRVSETSED